MHSIVRRKHARAATSEAVVATTPRDSILAFATILFAATKVSDDARVQLRDGGKTPGYRVQR